MSDVFHPVSCMCWIAVVEDDHEAQVRLIKCKSIMGKSILGTSVTSLPAKRRVPQVIYACVSYVISYLASLFRYAYLGGTLHNVVESVCHTARQEMCQASPFTIASYITG